MSLLSRFTSNAFPTKINSERLPSGTSASFSLGSGNASASGQAQQLAAMTSVGWLFATVNRIAQSIAAQEWKLYRK